MKSVCLTSAEAQAAQRLPLPTNMVEELNVWVLQSSLVIVTRNTSHVVVFISFWQTHRDCVKIVRVCRNPGVPITQAVVWEKIMTSQLAALQTHVGDAASATNVEWDWSAIQHLEVIQRRLSALLGSILIRPPVRTQLPTEHIPFRNVQGLIPKLATLLATSRV